MYVGRKRVTVFDTKIQMANQDQADFGTNAFEIGRKLFSSQLGIK